MLTIGWHTATFPKMGVSTKDLDAFLEIAENAIHRVESYISATIGFMELCPILRLG